MRSAVCYIRVSTEEQAKHGISLDAQEERLTAYCRMSDLEIKQMIREEGVSASKRLAVRPGGQELLRLVSSKSVEHVIAFKLDRLFRDAEDALHQTKAWDKLGVALHLVDMGGQTLNTASAMGRFFLNMMAGFAELERNLIAERTGTALAYKKNHLEAYSPVPYGFDRQDSSLIENADEQAVLGKVMAWRQAGLSLRKIADELTKRGVATKQGGKWHASTIKYLLANDLYVKEAA